MDDEDISSPFRVRRYNAVWVFSDGRLILLKQEPEFCVLKEDESPCIFGPIVKQRWSYACAKQLIERLVFGE